MANLNKVFLIGNLTRDPELRHTPSGAAVVSFGMAINRTSKGQDGESKEEVCYVDVNAFGKRAETINEYFKKGKPILIEGRLQFNQWETKDGQKRNTLRVVAENFQFIGVPQNGQGQRTNGQTRRNGNAKDAQYANDDINNEEIPF